MSKQHLFLTGRVQEGKSTLIRRLIGGYTDQIGGYSSQRLLGENGETVGFRIVPAIDAMELTKAYSPELEDVFLSFKNKIVKKNPEVFSTSGIKFLQNNLHKKLILLDEIGGMELMVPDFRQELYKTLSGDIPCLGVLKLEESHHHMCKNASLSKDCTDYYLILRDDLDYLYRSKIIEFRRDNREPAEKAVVQFLKKYLDNYFVE